MPVASQDEQFKFLISCIRYSNNGKVDFAEVARECEIVSKGAAAKRYERMMKFHGLHQPASGARETFKPANAKEPKSRASTPSITKATKRTAVDPSSATKKPRKTYKGFDDGSCNLAMDDDEGLIPEDSGLIKTENLSPFAMKEESQVAEYHGMEGFQYSLSEDEGGRTGEGDADMLSGLLQPQDFEHPNEL